MAIKTPAMSVLVERAVVEAPRPQSEFSDYGLEWLFDPDRVDHLPIEEQLKLFKQRDLGKTKFYKTAARIFGAPRSRRRVIVAPPMETVHDAPVHTTLASETMENLPTFKAKESKGKSDDDVTAEKIADYKRWIEERRHFRHDLDNMGLSIQWLQNKPDRTALETSLLRKMIEEETKTDEEPVKKEKSEPAVAAAFDPDDIPLINRSSPMAMEILQQFLISKRMRLLDLFHQLDKDKDWKLSRDEFKQAMKKAKVPITDVLLEDLILSLDENFDDELDYRELAKGMQLWKKEQRAEKRAKIEKDRRQNTLDSLGIEAPRPEPLCDVTIPQPRIHSSVSYLGKDSTVGSRPSTVTSPDPARSGTDGSRLATPPADLRPEQHVEEDEEMVDRRARDRVALARTQRNTRRRAKAGGATKDKANTKTVVKTGNRCVDRHLEPTTMQGELSESLDAFRMARHREYLQVLELCAQRGATLSEPLLERVLLYPGEAGKRESRLRPLPNGLLSKHFFLNKSQGQSKTHSSHEARLSPARNKRKKFYTQTDTMRGQSGGAGGYPSQRSVQPRVTKEYLSTGKAYVCRKVDCYMSFEEYDRLTRLMSVRYTQLYGPSDSNAFWPGHLLDRVRLCMPDSAPASSSDTVFTRIPRNPPKIYHGYDNDLKTWPRKAGGTIQMGFIDPYKNKYI